MDSVPVESKVCGEPSTSRPEAPASRAMRDASAGVPWLLGEHHCPVEAALGRPDEVGLVSDHLGIAAQGCKLATLHRAGNSSPQALQLAA